MNRIRTLLGLALNYFLDYLIYIKESGIFNDNNEEKLTAKMTYYYHLIEKGLSMTNLRLGFGKKKITELLKLVRVYQRVGFDIKKSQFITACSVLAKYYEIHKKENFKIEDYFNYTDYELIKLYSENSRGGTVEILRSEYFSKTKNSFIEFVKSRHSIRYFSDKLVEINNIKHIVEVANFCPSACNRQPCKVYSVNDKSMVDKILRIQQGIDSTSEFIYQLLVVTSNRNYFFTSGERNQIFVDGGIFLESLLLSLHAESIAACPLHWSLNYSHDQKIKKLIGLSGGEKVIALIAFGHLKDDLKVPASYRKQANEIFVEV
jgi:nitroreductase